MANHEHGSVLLAQHIGAVTLGDERFVRFAEGLGVNKVYLWQIGKGIRKPSLDLACKIEQLTDGAIPPSSWAGEPPNAKPARPRKPTEA